ncbi:MAG: MlaD family protein [Opitutales bacterium]|jgi:paraquat-inducible protein B
MSRLNNPTLVGIFVLAAAFLGMGTVIFVASMKLFRAEETLLVYFGESVNGLSVGSPVKFKGVPIGKVRDIRISHNQMRPAGISYVPVFVSIDLTKVGGKLEGGMTIDFTNPVKFKEVVRDGLRAKLQMASLITGQLYVELDFFEPAGSLYRQLQLTPQYLEIPSVPSDMAELGSTASDILAQFASINVKKISENLITVLERLDKVVQEIDFRAWNSAVIGTADTLQETLRALQVEETIPELRAALVSLNSVATKLDTAIDPALADYHTTLEQLQVTLKLSNRLLANLEDMTSADGNVRHEIINTLQELQNASRSARELLSLLERNPNAILTGRANP